MSKGNMFLGYARGKVGDVVFSRTNGEQITRARNRHPANPRTDGQLATRAILATVGKAYSAGAFIFDHAFQGLKVGSGNQQRFMSANIQLFRQTILDVKNGDTAANELLFVRPNALGPVAGPYIVSEGELVQTFWKFTREQVNQQLYVSTPVYLVDESGAEPVTENVGQYAARTGLVAGDIYTFVFFADPQSDELYPQGFRFGFVRMRVRDLSEILSQSMSDTSLAEVFEYLASDFLSSTAGVFEAGFTEDPADLTRVTYFLECADNNYLPMSVAVIRSREDSGQRSFAQMRWVYNETSQNRWANVANYIDIWAAGGESVTDPQLLLEGGNKDNVGVVVDS